MTNSQKAVIIVGGAKEASIGEAIRLKLVEQGYQVYTIDQQFPMNAGYDSMFALGNVADVQGFRGAIERVIVAINSSKQSLLGVIYAAGYNRIGSVGEYSMTDWELTMNVNLKGVFILAQELINHKLRNLYRFCFDGVAPIQTIVLGSNTAYVAKTKSFAYAASKAGLVHMCKSMHRELAPQGMYFTTLDFGIVMDSGMTAGTYEDLKRERGWEAEETTKMLLANVPTKQPVTRSELASWVAFLLETPNSAGGNSIRLDSGQQTG